MSSFLCTKEFPLMVSYFGFSKKIIALIKVEVGHPLPFSACHRPAHTACLRREAKLSPPASDPGSGPIVWQHPSRLLSSCMSLKHIHIPGAVSVKMASMPILHTTASQSTSASITSHNRKRRERGRGVKRERERGSHCGVSDWFVKVSFPKGAPVSF